MFQLDDNFFKGIDIDRMSPEEAAVFKQHVQEELEARIGERITDGFSNEKLEEFEKIIDDVPGFVDNWLMINVPDFRSNRAFNALVQQNGGQENRQTIAEFASMKWLEINRPDFNQITTIVMKEMQDELKANIDKIFS
jgi:hypothetical protein